MNVTVWKKKKHTRRQNIYLNTHTPFFCKSVRTITRRVHARLRVLQNCAACCTRAQHRPVKYFRVFLVPGQVVSSTAAQKKKCLNSITFWLTSVCGGVGATTKMTATAAQFLPRTPCNILNPFNESYDFILLSLLLLHAVRAALQCVRSSHRNEMKQHCIYNSNIL